MAVGTTPMLEKGLGAELPERPPIQTMFVDREAREGPPPQNHYPLETPEGVIPVEELVYHGRMRGERPDWYYDEPDYVELDAEYESYYDEREVAHLASYDPQNEVRRGVNAVRNDDIDAEAAVTIVRGSQVGTRAAPAPATTQQAQVQPTATTSQSAPAQQTASAPATGTAPLP